MLRYAVLIAAVAAFGFVILIGKGLEAVMPPLVSETLAGTLTASAAVGVGSLLVSRGTINSAFSYWLFWIAGLAAVTPELLELATTVNASTAPPPFVKGAVNLLCVALFLGALFGINRLLFSRTLFPSIAKSLRSPPKSPNDES